MWIKKIDYSLYISLLFQMIFATLLSIGLFMSIVTIADYFEAKAMHRHFEEEKYEIEKFVEEIKTEVALHNLTLEEAQDEEYERDNYEVDIYANYDAELAKFNYFSSNNYIFNASFAGQDGFLVFESEEAEAFYESMPIIAGVLSLIIFFSLSIRIIFNLVSYIKVIEDGIKKLSDDDESYKIPVIGQNELARLAKSVNEIKEELHKKTKKERADELYQRMLITNISHDLRTPLTSILGYLDLAKKNTLADNANHDYLSIAQKNGFRLEKLINDLFLYSKILSEDIQMNYKEVNVLILLKQILELKSQNIQLSSNLEDAIVVVDIEYFHRIIDNLLDNAIKYSTSADEIKLDIFEKSGRLHLVIENPTNEDLSNKINLLTNRLYTADENRKQGSSGLGLSIVLELCKKMNADFTIKYTDNIVKALVVLDSVKKGQK